MARVSHCSTCLTYDVHCAGGLDIIRLQYRVKCGCVGAVPLLVFVLQVGEHDSVLFTNVSCLFTHDLTVMSQPASPMQIIVYQHFSK